MDCIKSSVKNTLPDENLRELIDDYEFDKIFSLNGYFSKEWKKKKSIDHVWMT